MTLAFKKDRERFYAKVDADGPVPAHRPELGPCAVWTASIHPEGYGQFGFGPTHAVTHAHRVAWILDHGEIPKRIMVCHHCDNRRCVRLSHLFLGTNKDNIQDAARKCRMGKLSAADVADIRARIAAGEVQARIAREYGVVPATITHIKTGHTYSEVV
jgi:hypothetical protein